jgi:tRNA(Arg) A34 adenosine deaminase TadA
MSYCQKTNHMLSRRMLIGLSCGLLGGISLARSEQVEAADASKIVQPVSPTKEALINRAFAMRDMALSQGDQGYGAIIVNTLDRRIVAQAPSRVVIGGDPTAHAEMEAIRDAARRLGARDLSGHTMYSSSKPCPMCEAAAYWAGVDELYYGASGTAGGMPKLC